MIEQKIRDIAKELLEKKTVDLVIGFSEWTLPLRATPIFIRTPGGANRLTWNSFCENNLATYIHKFSRSKVGLVVKGCDARSITALSLEKRFKPDQLFLIGVPCQRMVDRRKVQRAVPAEILHAREEGNLIYVKGEGFDVSLKREDYLYSSCQACIHRNPVKADVWIGDPVEEFPLSESYAEARTFEKMSPEDRWRFFDEGDQSMHSVLCLPGSLSDVLLYRVFC
jgi:coenzyme F420-reducing hydrogenase beta subunit